MKRGQVTIFIILAIVILVIIAGFFIIKNLNQELSFKSLSFDQQIDIVIESIQSCFEETYKDALDMVGIQGGYYNEPLSEYYIDDSYTIPYYYFGTLNYIPSIELIEEDLGFATGNEKIECLDVIQEYGLDYDFESQLNNVSIKEGEITFYSNLKLTLSKSDSSTTIDFKEHPIIIKSNLHEMNSFGSYIAYSHDINEGSICISCFTEISAQKNLDVYFYDDIEDILFIEIIDNRTDYHPDVYSFFMTNLPPETEQLSPPVIQEDSFNQETRLNTIAPRI